MSAHIVERLRRSEPCADGRRRVYGYRCSCGSSWKIYQTEYHQDGNGKRLSGREAGRLFVESAKEARN